MGFKASEFPSHIVDRKRRMRMQHGPQLVALTGQGGQSRNVGDVVSSALDFSGKFPEAGKNLVACQIALLDMER